MDAWSEMPRQLDKPTALVWILSTFFFNHTILLHGSQRQAAP
jgi:hypothetical protein